MKTLFVMNGVTFGASGQPSVSGGDFMLIEIAKRWLQKGVEVHFMTSSAGKELCERLGLRVICHLSSGSSSPSIQNYFFSALKAATAEHASLTKEYFDLVYSSCEHLYDVLPAFKLKRRNVKWVAMVHFVPPLPWTRTKAGRLNAVLYYLNHLLGALLIRNSADIIFAVSQRTASDYVRELKFDESKVVTVPGGVDYSLIRAIAGSTHEKIFDAVFMKRLQPMKGIFDVIEIWRRVVRAIPSAKLRIVGDGPVEVVARMQHMITQFGLTNNIELKGPVYDIKEKFTLLAQSRLFLLPSHEENWAIVIGEAFTAGIPVIAYYLPEIAPIWKNNVSWVRKGDVNSFADRIVKLLSNEITYTNFSRRGLEFMKQYDWNVIAEKELKISTNRC